MTRSVRAVVCSAAVAGLSACPSGDDDSGEVGGGVTTAASDASTAASDGSTATSDDSSENDSNETDWDTGEDTGSGALSDSDEPPNTGSYIGDPDGGGVAIECSVWEQDCPEGEKCMPWANDGGNAWNATKCTPLDPQPDQPGEPCTVQGSGVSGVDSCDVAAMCWNVDSETNAGDCVAFCSGVEENPVCDDASTTCMINNDGVLALCMPSCDPLLQDCPDGQGCYGISGVFVCSPDKSDELGDFGDPCQFVNSCDPGLGCVAAAGVPGCGSPACCSTFCDTSDPGASAACEGAAGGQECVPYFEAGEVPDGYENVGVCVIPM